MNPSVHSEVPPFAGDLNPSKRPKRIPKKRVKCGKSAKKFKPAPERRTRHVKT